VLDASAASQIDSTGTPTRPAIRKASPSDRGSAGEIHALARTAVLRPG
jgi:hypothetical protein